MRATLIIPASIMKRIGDLNIKYECCMVLVWCKLSAHRVVKT